jgi:tetratricopeptide (TPR) repeat protein
LGLVGVKERSNLFRGIYEIYTAVETLDADTLPLHTCLCADRSLCGHDKISPAAKEELKLGVKDYKQARYESAIQHFKEAARLSPDFVQAHLYQATALTQQYIPGVDTPENLSFADQAIESYKQVLVLNPKNISALKGLAWVNFNLKRFEDAKSYYRQASQVDPLDPEAFYSIGVADWTESYKRRMDERSKRGLPTNGSSSITQSFCPKLKTDNLPLIEEGIQVLKKAIELRPDYDDAMVYLNLLFRERAEIECNDDAARSDDERQANEWSNWAMAARGQKLKKATEHQAPQNQ